MPAPIAGTASYGVYLYVGGSVSMARGTATGALISGGTVGVFSLNGFSTVTNYGTIRGVHNGVKLEGSAGSVTNFGKIQGTGTVATCVPDRRRQRHKRRGRLD